MYTALICFAILSAIAGVTARRRMFQLLGIVIIISLSLMFFGAAQQYYSLRSVASPWAVLPLLWFLGAMVAGGVTAFMSDSAARVIQAALIILACTVASLGILLWAYAT